VVALFARARDNALKAGRREHWHINQSELVGYRKVKTREELTELDRIFFEEHRHAVSFERPLSFWDFPECERAVLGGTAIVIWVDDDERLRLPKCEMGLN
jgi:hypothetical protein